MVYHLNLLKMALQRSLCLTVFCLLFSSFCNAQTVFITSEKEIKKDPNELGEYEKTRPVYTQAAFSFPLSINPEFGEPTGFEDEKEPFFLPDGLSAHAGAGVHYRGWIGVGMNVGIDWKLNQKLVSAPVYASVFLNPHFNETTSFFLQGGYGRAFALGRGELNGIYQKYRVGILSDNLLIFADLNLFGYGLHGTKEMGSLSIGVSLMDLFNE
jgi:hypothetical protein